MSETIASAKEPTQTTPTKKPRNKAPPLAKSYTETLLVEAGEMGDAGGRGNGSGIKRWEIGLDEAGRGPLFGSVFVGAAVLPRPCDPTFAEFKWEDMKDSKRFSSRKKRAEVAEYIRQNAIAWHVASVNADEIDRINILQAVFKGMHECVRVIGEQMAAKGYGKVLFGPGGSGPDSDASPGALLVVDGNTFEPFSALDDRTGLYEFPEFVCVEGGDNRFCNVAAASILAKVAHDGYIEDMCRRYPVLEERYGLLSGMGYATARHLEGIRRFGITQWHRRTFGSTCGNATYGEI
jgi:ribonuclease HII